MSHDHDVDGFQERSTSDSTTLFCDVGKLREAGGKVSQAANGLAGVHGRRHGLLSPTTGQGSGLRVIAAVLTAATNWSSHLSTLASRAATTGINLMAAANHTAGTDHYNAGQLRRIQADHE